MYIFVCTNRTSKYKVFIHIPSFSRRFGKVKQIKV